jgi:hypothetical protein
MRLLMTVEWKNNILSSKIRAEIVFVGLLSVMLVTSFISIDDFDNTIMVSGSVQPTEEPGENVVQIVKDSMTSYSIVNNKTEFIGAFDTTYSISGSIESLIGSHDAIISVVQDDFISSPTIGYIKAGNSSTSSSAESPFSNNLTLPNPFVDSATINGTISQKVSTAIESLHGQDQPMVDIKCDFDMNIEDWKCINQGLNSR